MGKVTKNSFILISLGQTKNFFYLGSIKLASLIQQQKSLKKLNIAAMGIRDKGFLKIAESLSQLSLVELDISSNEITAKAAESLISSLKNSIGSLQKLNLDENELGSSSIKLTPFINFLRENEFKSLTHLSLKQNQLRKSSVLSLLNSLSSSFPLLSHLDLNENYLSKSDLEDVYQVLGEGKSFLQSMEDCLTEEDEDEENDDDSDEN